MKKLFYLSIMLIAFPVAMLAQDDDMYFVPSKKNVEHERPSYGVTVTTTHSGSWRDVDEYNRRGESYYEVLPADTGDIVSFAPVEGVYPDSIGDFQLTRKMSRWDGYEPAADYWAGYSQGINDSWRSWHSPWYYSSYYPWYDFWYDPWLYDPWYSWHYSWYDPWYSWHWGGYYSSWYYYRPWYYTSYGWGGGYAHNWDRGVRGSYRNVSHGTYGSRDYSLGSRGYADGSLRTTGRYAIGSTTGSRGTYDAGSRRTGTSIGTYNPRTTGSRGGSVYSGGNRGTTYGTTSTGSRGTTYGTTSTGNRGTTSYGSSSAGSSRSSGSYNSGGGGSRSGGSFSGGGGGSRSGSSGGGGGGGSRSGRR